jgi:hypothetical protein
MAHVILTIGYSQYKLPENIKLDHIKEIVNAECLVDYYGSEKCYGYAGKKEISLNVIEDNAIVWIQREAELDEVQLELSKQIEVRLRKKGNQARSIKFTPQNIRIGSNQLSWPEFSDPEFNPDEFVLKMVSEAINHSLVGRW